MCISVYVCKCIRVSGKSKSSNDVISTSIYISIMLPVDRQPELRSMLLFYHFLAAGIINYCLRPYWPSFLFVHEGFVLRLSGTHVHLQSIFI